MCVKTAKQVKEVNEKLTTWFFVGFFCPNPKGVSIVEYCCLNSLCVAVLQPINIRNFVYGPRSELNHVIFRYFVTTKLKCLYLYWKTLSATQAVLLMGDPSWVQCYYRRKPEYSEETGVLGENLRCLVESNWTRIFSNVALIKGNFNQITARSRNRTLVTVVRDTCTTTVPPVPLTNSQQL